MAVLKSDEARGLLKTLLPELGATDRERLETVLRNTGSGKARLSDCLPAGGLETALTAFRGFRKRVNDLAKEMGIPVRLEVDTLKKNSPDQRWCWFEDPEPAARRAEAYSDAVTSD